MKNIFNRVPTVRQRTVRESVWKGLNIVVAVVTLANVSAAGLFLAPKAVSAGGSGDIWTNTTACGSDGVDINHFAIGDHIFIHGKNFSEGDYSWTITGNPGGASGDPGTQVAGNTQHVDSSGIFCFDAYTVQNDDWGEYQVKFGDAKGDNYRVDGATVGSILFTKFVDSGTASPDDFSFNINPDPQNVSSINTLGGTYTFEGLTPGTYSISEESGPGGYHTASTTCDSVTVVAGQQATCEIHNAADPHTFLTVHKMLDANGNGQYTNIDGTANAMGFHWGLAHFDGLDLVSQWGTPTDLGTHGFGDGLTEVVPTGYVYQGWFYGTDGSCTPGEGFHAPGSSVFLDAGSSTSVTICNAKVLTQPSLTISKTDNHVTAQPGETLTYQVTITNSGDLGAEMVQVDDTLPNFLSAPANISNSGVFSAGHIVWDNIFVAGHSSVTLTYDATINPVMPVGTTILHNVATLGCSPFSQIQSVSAASFECPYSGTATDDTSVTVVAPTLTIAKTNNSGSFVNPGATVTYTIVVTNAASATQSAVNVVLNDTLPAGFTYTVGGGSTKSFNLGNIAPGASVTTTYTVLVSASEATGTYTNTATAKGDNTTSVNATSNVNVHVPQVLGISTPTLSLAKVVDQKTSNPGKIVTYTLTVTNSGDGAAANTDISDTLPAGFTFADNGTSTRIWHLGSLAAGAHQSVTYQVKIGSNVKAGTYVNHALATADGVDPVSAIAPVKVIVPAVLGLATTGVSARDYAIFVLGSVLLALGFIGLQSARRHELQALAE